MFLMNDCSEIKTSILSKNACFGWMTEVRQKQARNGNYWRDSLEKYEIPHICRHIFLSQVMYKHVRGCVLRKVKVFLLKGRQSFPLYRRSNFDTYRTPEYAERPSTSIVWDTVIIIVTIVNYGCNQLIDIFFSLTTIGYRNYLILSNSSSIFF